MERQAVTFDFHETLAHCDGWFQLEIKSLPGAFLAWHERERGGFAPASAAPALDRAYRQLRTSIIEHGHELSAERALAVICENAGYHVAQSDISEGTHALMTAAVSKARPVDGAIETVTALSDAGFRLGVVSSAVFHPFLEWSLARFGVQDRFQVIVTSAGCGYYKSRPEIYWAALSSLAAAPEQSLHIGDSARFDVDGAARAGMKTAWLLRPPTTPPTTNPDLVLSSLVGSAPSLHNFLQSVL